MVLSGRVRPLNSCLSHVSHGVCQVGSVLPLPAFFQRSLHSFLYQYSSLFIWFGRLPGYAHAGVPVVGSLPGSLLRTLLSPGLTGPLSV